MRETVSSAHRFGVRTLLLEAGSSAAATHTTLRSLAEVKGLDAYRPELLALAGQAGAVQITAKADALRAELQGAGWLVETTKQGTTLRRA